MRAYWQVSESWRSGWRVIVESLDGDERAAFQQAAQVLVNCLSIWEKTVLAASRGS